MTEVLPNAMVIIILQYISIPNECTVYLKLIQYINYISIKLKKQASQPTIQEKKIMKMNNNNIAVLIIL